MKLQHSIAAGPQREFKHADRQTHTEIGDQLSLSSTNQRPNEPLISAPSPILLLSWASELRMDEPLLSPLPFSSTCLHVSINSNIGLCTFMKRYLLLWYYSGAYLDTEEGQIASCSESIFI